MDLISFDLNKLSYETCMFFGLAALMTFFNLLDAVRLLYTRLRCYQFHQILLVVSCDNQELACTPKDPPRRADTRELSLFFCKTINRVIEYTV